MKKVTKDAIIAAGRAHLAAWLKQAEANGTIYYSIPHVARSGMSRQIKLYSIADSAISQLWPSTGDAEFPGVSWSEAIDIVAHDWGFDFKTRSFKVSGGGMDMVFWLVGHLAYLAFPGDPSGRDRYANRVRRDSL